MLTKTAWMLTAALLAAPGVAEAKRVAAGKPSFTKADPEAMWLWSDESGWHLRVTPGKGSHNFHGVLRGEGLGNLTWTKPTLGAKVQMTRKTLRFDFDQDKRIDGFDWTSDSPCLIVELKLDAHEREDRVHVGASGAVPSGIPFEACKS